jgi:hypothetical protein
MAAFAEATYRMGFHHITAGAWLADLLGERFGITADAFEFGSDDRYRLADTAEVVKSGVIFHARHDTPRRAFELGLMALEVFARRHPLVPITLYGGTVSTVNFAHRSVGVIAPDALASLYQRSRVGLSLSFTNASLVPHEMLAAGCIPVVNEAVHNRRVLDNDHIRYATPDPHSLAQALGAVIDNPHADSAARAASHSVTTRRWSEAGDTVCGVLERELWR